MKKSTITLALSLLMSTQLAMAVPAKPTPMVFTQPDGTTVTLRKIGDERRHMTITTDGYPVVTDAKGFYCYAELDEAGELRATAVKAAPIADLNPTERQAIGHIDATKIREAVLSRPASTKFSAPLRMGAHGGIGLMDNAFVGRKELTGLVILAEYSDVKFSETCTREFFTEMLNTPGFSQFGATGSARDYFIDSSTGQFIPTFDVYGPVTLENPMEFYGGNDSKGDDKNAVQMIYDACKGLDDQINFKDYDLDGDGYVDNVFVFYAGYGEASYGSDDSVWPHQWNLSSGGLSLTLDGVQINKYACSNELELDSSRKPIPDGIGTFVHEFSHVLGLPDLYATNSNGNWTPGTWSVLDQGPYNNDSRTPPAYSIYERNALGWIDPVVIDGAETITLEAINKSNQGYIIPTSDINEFFLIENRQQTGWDKYIPGHGMLVWHIDYDADIWRRNTVNNNRSHCYVDIEEARGSWADPTDFAENGYINYDAYSKALSDYAFPGSMGATSFTDTTIPAMKTWDGVGLGLPITDISETNGVITFNVLGGRCDAAVPVIATPSEVGQDYFVANWNASEGATEYFLTVQAVIKEGVPTTLVADFGSSTTQAELPEGWSFISTTGDVYTAKSSCGESAPSLKLSKNGSGFMTDVFDGNIKSISFWLKGMATDQNSIIAIEGFVDGNWRNIHTVTPQSLKAITVNIDNIPEGVRQLRFTYTKSMGNVAIDDIKIVYGGAGNITLDDYNALAVGNVTSYRVDKLMDGVDEYVYKVCAADASAHRSAYSQEQAVTLGQNAGIESVTSDPASNFSIDGRNIIYTGSASDRITLTDISGRIYADQKADEEGRASITAPSAGVYILSVPGKTHKLIVR